MPRQYGRGHDRQGLPRKWAADRRSERLFPLRVSLVVVHHERVIGKLPGGAKRQHLTIDRSAVNDTTRTDRAPRDRDGELFVVCVRVCGSDCLGFEGSRYLVVDDLVITEDLDRIRPRWIALDDNHVIAVIAKIRSSERRLVDARNRVPREDVLDVHILATGGTRIVA